MAASIPNELVDSVNCPECGYNNIAKAKTCAGTKNDGTTCDKELYVIV